MRVRLNLHPATFLAVSLAERVAGSIHHNEVQYRELNSTGSHD